MYDNGTYNSVARVNIAVFDNGLLFFVNYLEPRVFQMSGSSKFDFVAGNLPYDTAEPFARSNYPLRAPSSITYASMSDSLIFADTDNDRIMRLSLANGYIYCYAGYPGGSSFVDNIDATAMPVVKLRVVDYNPITGKIFFVDGGNKKVYYVDVTGKVHHLAGNGTANFSGDGGPATAAGLRDPRAITVDSRGNAYIADNENHAIRMVVVGVYERIKS